MNKYTDKEIDAKERRFKDKVNNSLADYSDISCWNCGRFNFDWEVAEQTKFDGSEELPFERVELDYTDAEIGHYRASGRLDIIQEQFKNCWKSVQLGHACGCAEKKAADLNPDKVKEHKHRTIYLVGQTIKLKIWEYYSSLVDTLNKHGWDGIDPIDRAFFEAYEEKSPHLIERRSSK